METKLRDRLVALCLAVCFIFVGCPLPTNSAQSPGQPTLPVLPPIAIPDLPALEYLTPEDIPPDAVSVTGSTGPGGGIVIDKLDSRLPHTLEIMPYRDNYTLTYNAANVTRNFGGQTGWRLPTATELNQMYFVQVMRNKIGQEQLSPFPEGMTGLVWTSTPASSTFMVVLFLTDTPVLSGDANEFYNGNFASSHTLGALGACYVRVIE